MPKQHFFWGHTKMFGPKHFLVRTETFGPEKKISPNKIFGRKIIFVQKKLLIQTKTFGQKFFVIFFLSQQILCLKIFWVGRGINFLALDTPRYLITGPIRCRGGVC